MYRMCKKELLKVSMQLNPQIKASITSHCIRVEMHILKTRKELWGKRDVPVDEVLAI